MKKFTLIFLVIIGCYSGLTYLRNKVWKDEITLWSDIVQKAPQNARGHNNLGLALKLSGDFKTAKVHYLKAIELDSDYVGPYSNLGNIAALQGDLKLAQENYKKALSFDPDRVDVRSNLSVILLKDRKFTQAVVEFEKILEIEPNHRVANKYITVAKLKASER